MKMKMKILLTGGTGLIGQELGKALVAQGHEVLVATRDQKKAQLKLSFPCRLIEVDLQQQQIPAQFIEDVDAVYHLAGENIGEKRWSAKQKREILASRISTTQNLLQSLKNSQKVQTLIMTSAIGYYGDRADDILTEKSELGEGFLAQVCRQWEQAFHEGATDLKHQSCRQVIFRTSVVLSPFGGALEKIKAPFLFGLGSALGDGQQWFSWIHIQDLVRVCLQALTDSRYQGVINAVAPQPALNLQMSQMISEIIGTRLKPSVPKIIMQTVLGEMATMVLQSQRVHSELLAPEEFLFTNLRSALEDCLQYHQTDDLYFHAEQFIPHPQEKVFPFFSAAENLQKITPAQLNFQIVKQSTEAIQEGTLIDYRLRIHGLPVGWRTQITEWQPGKKFTDTQLKGPYRKWHHTHSFAAMDGGTLMTDLVRYQLPFGKFGHLLAGYLVKKDIQSIFDYRRKSVAKYLTQSPSEDAV